MVLFSFYLFIFGGAVFVAAQAFSSRTKQRVFSSCTAWEYSLVVGGFAAGASLCGAGTLGLAGFW